MNKYLCILFLLLLSPLYAQQVSSTDENVVFVCHFNEGSGGVVSRQLGSANGTTNSAWITGKFSSGIYINGTDTVGLNYSPNISDNILVSVWVMIPTGQGTGGRGLTRFNGGYGWFNGWTLVPYNSNGGLTVEADIFNGPYTQSTVNTTYSPSGIYSLDTWHLVSLFFSSGVLQKPIVYVNNEDQYIQLDRGTTSSTIGSNGGEFIRVGSFVWGDGSTYYDDGICYDDVSIYKNVTSEAQAHSILKRILINGRGMHTSND